MKTLLLFSALFLFLGTEAKAKRKIAIVGLGDGVTEVASLDEEDRLMGLPSDIAYGYYRKNFQLFFVPMFTWGGQSVLSSDSEDSIWELDEEQIEYFDEKYGSASSKMSWQKLCNFIIPGLIVLFFILKRMGGGGATTDPVA